MLRSIDKQSRESVESVLKKKGKVTVAILSNSTRKLLRFEITEMLVAVLKWIYCFTDGYEKY